MKANMRRLFLLLLISIVPIASSVFGQDSIGQGGYSFPPARSGGPTSFTDNAQLALKSTFSLGASSYLGDAFTYENVIVAATFDSGGSGPCAIQFISLVNPASPSLLTSVVPHMASCNNVGSPFVFGKFLYFTASNNGISATVWETWDITNLSSPVWVSSIPCPDQDWAVAWVADGKVFLLSTPQGTLYVYDITNRAAPVLLGSLTGTGYADGLNTLAWRGPLLIWSVANGGGDGSTIAKIFDVSNPAKPSLVSSVSQGASGNFSGYAVAIKGYNLFVGVTDRRDCTMVTCDQMFVYDIKDPASPSLVATVPAYASNGISAFVLGGDVVYAPQNYQIPGVLNAISIVNPLAPAKIGSYTDSSNGGWGTLYMLGKYIIFLVCDSDCVTTKLDIVEAPGFSVPTAQIGVLHVGTMVIDDDLRVEGGMLANTHLKVGPLGAGSQGAFSGIPGGNDFRCQTYVLSNNGTNFTINGVAGLALPAATAASPVLFALPARGKVVSVASHTTTAWSGTGFTAFHSTIGDSVGGTTYYDSGSYDLHAAASDTNFQTVGGLFKSATYAGSNVIVRVTADANLNSNAITGATDYEVCWMSQP